jgi:hypothetical protein
MTVLENTIVSPDDVAAHWLDVIEEMAKERVDYDGSPIEAEMEEGGGSLTIGKRRVRIVGAWSEVVFQWFEVGGSWSEGDYRLPLTFDNDEAVDDLGTTVRELLDEAVGYLEGWRADIDWSWLEHSLWNALDGQDGLLEDIEYRWGKCYVDERGYVWGWLIDAERGYAEISAGLMDDGTVYWSEYGVIEGLDVLLDGMAAAVAEAVADIKERLGK